MMGLGFEIWWKLKGDGDGGFDRGGVPFLR
jgi:hypothetical protein